MQIIYLVFKLFRVLRTLRRKHPVKLTLFYLCLLFFVGIEVWFNFAPPPTSDWIVSNLRKIRIGERGDFSFAVFGDNKNSHSVFPGLLSKVDHDPDIQFAIDIGDLVFDGELEKYRYFIDQLRANIKKPVLTAIGNHELLGKGRGLYYELLGPFYYAFHEGEADFIVLDDADEKGIDAWQMEWLENELKNAQDYKFRFVFLHVPLFDPRGGEFAECLPQQAARPLLNLFKRYRVSHVFASHIHGYYKGRWEGIPYTITGGAGGELVGKDPGHDFFHYIKVSIKKDRVDMAVEPIRSPDYEWLDRIGSIVWLYLFSFVRFNGIQLALFLLMAYLLGAALKAEERKKGRKP